jgi:hypothetical protein
LGCFKIHIKLPLKGQNFNAGDFEKVPLIPTFIDGKQLPLKT